MEYLNIYVFVKHSDNGWFSFDVTSAKISDSCRKDRAGRKRLGKATWLRHMLRTESRHLLFAELERHPCFFLAYSFVFLSSLLSS